MAAAEGEDGCSERTNRERKSLPLEFWSDYILVADAVMV